VHELPTHLQRYRLPASEAGLPSDSFKPKSNIVNIKAAQPTALGWRLCESFG
jgi:hypothetical protein